jgi:hypothetical protein
MVASQRKQIMKYILMMQGTRADFDWYAQWTPEEFQAQGAFMETFTQELKATGVFVATEALGFPDQARRVRAGKDGEPVTDGVFPESKEFLAGYWIVDVESADEAYKLAARVSGAPGRKDRGNQPIEVIPVMTGQPEG